MQNTPKSSRHSTHMLARTNSVGRSLEESVEVPSSYSDSVRTGIVRIPRVPPIHEDGANTTTPQRILNNDTTISGDIEHHPIVSPPAPTEDHDSAKPNTSMSSAVVANVSSHDYHDNNTKTNTNVMVENHSKVSSPVSAMDHNGCVSDMLPTSSSTPRSVSQSEFTTNEQQLQVHLKQNNFPYRVMRRNVETDLEAGLQAYFELDVLDENNKFLCDKCTAERMEKRG